VDYPIVIPVINNGAEHTTAVVVASKANSTER
jgi:hypothetical protein